MLELKDIKKDYVTGSLVTHALRGLTLNFRKNEFVSILGPSGCGKTTLLNIIGGLDKYTSGDLLIERKSTKQYKDRDWDTYRNHYIGFIFQSYNLIMHQNVVQNVEIALTISGVSKKERHERAVEALKKVGLEEYITKMPNQLSGGQMQRVAIARALVNNPEILLADEPTGALDSETSVQIMELLKEIAKDRLVIMVTHNPDLAKEYSTRIIKLHDGLVTDDSNPCSQEEIEKEEIVTNKFKGKKKKSSMSFWTALGLSFKNLLSKKGRTILVSFAGSIGITGIALILSLSDGFHNYVNQIQEDTLSTYPLTLSQNNTQLSLDTFDLTIDEDLTEFPDNENTYEASTLTTVIQQLSGTTYENDLTSFKHYLESPETINKYSKHYNAIQYVYGNIDMQFYNYDEGKYTKVYPVSYNSSSVARMFSSFFNSYDEFIDNQELLEAQYDLLKGSYPVDPYDVVIIVDKYNRVNDFVLYALGIRDFQEDLEKITNKEPLTKWSGNFDELLSLEYKSAVYAEMMRDNGDGTYSFMDSSSIFSYLKNTAPTIRVSGILRQKKSSTTQSISGSIGYSKYMTQDIIRRINESPFIIAQKANPTKNLTDNSDITEDQYKDLLNSFRVYDEDNPSSIKIYPKSFADKEKIKEMINEYNTTKVLDTDKIHYTDSVGTIISSVSLIVNSVTYVLIAFVSISLVVSSIMIGIITYVSVIERTKEIGTLRSLGASKGDIANIFNAETLMIGFTSGLLGCLLSMLLDIPIGLIIYTLTGIANLAYLMWYWSLALIGISMVLTFIAGLIPSQIASNKDPVVALRTNE